MREKTDLKLTAGRAKADRISVISSKSYVHRLLIGAFLCDEKPEVITNTVSDDMEATKRALAGLAAPVPVPAQTPSPGASANFIDGYPHRLPDHKDDRAIDCGESGSTARFILPLAAALTDGVTLTGSGKLPERPMGPLCDALRAAGVSVSSDNLPITVKGKPKAGDYEIPGNVSSQFITGLLFMLPLLSGDSHLHITGKLESAAYVDMTLDVLSRFGITVDRCEDGYKIKGPQKYRYTGGDKIEAEGDWSNGAYLMAIASLGSGRAFEEFTVEGLKSDSIQGDRAVVDVLSQFGVSVERRSCDDGVFSGYTVSGRPLKAVDINCQQIPDLVPALSVLAAYAKGNSTFRNVERLRIKECDRVDAISRMLGAVDVKVDIISHEGHEDMVIFGKGTTGQLKNDIVIDSFNDHRIAMAAAALAFAENAPVIIKDAMAVNKSYPGFYELIEKMGIASCRLH
ncbi:MAG: 3-phosphoshikimate 1-carboxyvinyltransferase [Lachnospiraceae bacterium]|nr:3-phosphoshikimate 1-carboxyvinyltransferase [Lachnospiraceae bacterium]